jgi:hypothetical protein
MRTGEKEFMWPATVDPEDKKYAGSYRIQVEVEIEDTKTATWIFNHELVDVCVARATVKSVNLTNYDESWVDYWNGKINRNYVPTTDPIEFNDTISVIKLWSIDEMSKTILTKSCGYCGVFDYEVIFVDPDQSDFINYQIVKNDTDCTVELHMTKRKAVINETVISITFKSWLVNYP